MPATSIYGLYSAYMVAHACQRHPRQSGKHEAIQLSDFLWAFLASGTHVLPYVWNLCS